MSGPRDEGNNIQTYGADANSQPAEPAPHDLSDGHSTRIETMVINASIVNRRPKAKFLDPPESRGFVGLHQQPKVQKAMRDLVVAIRASQFFIDNTLEPNLGTHQAVALTAVASDEIWRDYGTTGTSIYTLFIKADEMKYKCLWCGDMDTDRLSRAVTHVRKKHLRHTPFFCGDVHVGNEVW